MSARGGGRPLSIWITGEPVPEAKRSAGSFADMIRATVGDAWAGPWDVVDCVGEAALPGPGDAAGVIVTGSPARIADQLPWMRRAQDGLRRLVEADVPVLGICFGHQLLAMALGGRSGPNPRGREIGTVRVGLHCSDPLLGDGPRDFPASATHLDTVLELPPGAESLAATALDRYAAVRFGPEAWGVQFHPEMTAEIIGAYVRALREKLIAEDIDPDRILDARQETPEAAAVLRRFAARVAAGGTSPNDRRSAKSE
ncbi:MAG TPA: glutamine amidotransferase [Gammaproteobacteria bacterium]